MKEQIKKQAIEEMARKMCRNYMPNGNCAADDDTCGLECVYGYCAERIYCAGYRKQIEGKWKDQYQGMYENQLYKCSICGETAFHDDKRWFLTPYCPNCGAKMKGGAE